MKELKRESNNKSYYKGENKTQKPLANDLGENPKLQEIYHRVKGKRHPLDTTNIFSRLIFSYVGQYISLARKMVPTQECHHLLPKNEKVEKNRAQIGQRLYPVEGSEVEALPTDSDEIGFRMLPKMKNNLFTSFMGIIKKEFIYCFFLFFISSASEFGRLIILRKSLEDITDQINEFGRIQDKNKIFLDFLAVWGITLGSKILENAAMMQIYRFSIRLEGGLHGLMYEKFMRIGVVNPHEHDEGSIINYIQTDVASFNRTVLGLGIFFSTLVTLVASLYLGLAFFGSLFWILVGGFLICSLVTGVLVAMVMINYKNAKKETDKRLGVMKNVLKNIKFIKVTAMENFMFAKLSKARQFEVKYTVNSNRWQLIMVGFSRFFIGLNLVVFFYYYMNSGAEVTVANVTTLLMVFNLFMFGMIGTVGGLGFLAGSFVHVKRLTAFLNAREMVDFYKIKRQNPGSKYAVEIIDGSFYWDKKMSKHEAEEKRKAAMSGGKKGAKGWKKTSKVDAEGQKGQLKENLIEAENEGKNEKKVGFEMDGVNFRAKKGDLTVLIGKIGSGKSSLLYSLLGDMRIKDLKKTSVVVNGTVGFLSQNPWLINGTVKENILLDKDLDPKKFSWAVKYSALDHDIKIWDEKEDHFIGENGAALSGGQKARIALARCLYQEPDVYIFDDILSALDGTIGAFITEETILGQLKDKTVIMVTHGLQYLRYSDYIYVMDEGKIIQEGSFKDVEGSELYQKFLQLNKNQDELTEQKNIRERQTFETETHGKNSLPFNPHLRTENTTNELLIQHHEHSLKSGQKTDKISEETLTKEEQLPLSRSDEEELRSRLGSDAEATKRLLEVITRDEDRVIGEVSFEIFKKFIKNMGGPIPIIIVIIISLGSNFLNTFYQLLLEDFSNNFKKESLNRFLQTLLWINLGMVVLVIIGSFISVVLNRKISTQIHSKMAFALTHARLQGFLESVAYGQIQNRFSKDIGDVDTNSSTFFSNMITNLTALAIFLGTIMYSTSWAVIIALVVCTAVIFRVQKGYMIARREYKRLQAISSSPIVSNCSDIIKGLSYIRNMGLSDYFRKKYISQVSEKLKNDLLLNLMQLWFTVRSYLALSFLLILPAMAGMIYLFGDVNPGGIGLFFLIINQISNRFESTVNMKTNLETFMISIERCDYFTKLEPENGYRTLDIEKRLVGNGKLKNIEKLIEFEERGDTGVGAPSNNQNLDENKLIKSGRVMFDNVSARYLGTKSRVLHNVSFSTEKGEKVGIVGRSGSGKSTLIKLLWRYMKAEDGSILIDGHDLSMVDIKALRSQLTVITQETALFEGPLRYNLDPTEYRFNDEQMTAILDRLGFDNSEYKKKGLDMEVDSEGINLSQGEKQLICFARAALRPSSLILLDEATASIDIKTEEAIQNLIKTDFKDSTMIIVAHRVHTIMECDKIIVMRDGRIEGLGRPDQLMESSEFFSDIVKKMKEQ